MQALNNQLFLMFVIIGPDDLRGHESLQKVGFLFLNDVIEARKVGKNSSTGHAEYTVDNTFKFVSKLENHEAANVLRVSALELFYHAGMIKHMEILLEMGADPNITGVIKTRPNKDSSVPFGNYTLLHDAIVSGKSEEAKLLLRYGALPGPAIKNAYLIHHVIDASDGLDIELLDRLLDTGLDLFSSFQTTFKLGVKKKEHTVKSSIIGQTFWKCCLNYDFQEAPEQIKARFKREPNLMQPIDRDLSIGVGRIIYYIFNQHGEDAIYKLFKEFEYTVKVLNPNNKRLGVGVNYDLGVCIQKLAEYSLVKTAQLMANLYSLFMGDGKACQLHRRVLFNNEAALDELLGNKEVEQVMVLRQETPASGAWPFRVIPYNAFSLANILKLEHATGYMQREQTCREISNATVRCFTACIDRKDSSDKELDAECRAYIKPHVNIPNIASIIARYAYSVLAPIDFERTT